MPYHKKRSKVHYLSQGEYKKFVLKEIKVQNFKVYLPDFGYKSIFLKHLLDII